ncbi:MULTISPECIES: DUF1850 domain-containing protein [Pontibacillus]|uniref:DUF1850 domain-containing protein n=1 Tax=Pontibacillus chungwhensis TaxID=265426 RepID=A0ABY8V1E0_9BACI|nr:MULTISPECIES: DUF1850 domain-containing protein [Pontibacillus]MCD5324648.1 DUF1850 domain-containing protein [Pontibacillus sp. HN14]WIF99057.1 DUF1850 domain-containing protein [Pontibacillus chungwhensis]
MKNRRTQLVVAISLIAVTALAVLIFYPNRTVITFQHIRSGEELAYLPIHHQRHFQINYIHSVHLSEVIEEFEVQKDNSIKPKKLIYEDTAIGMPSNAYGDDTFEMKDEKYIITKGPSTKPLPFINLSVGQVRSKHRIVYDGESYLLKEYVGAGTSIKIEARDVSMWQMWKGVKMSE